MRSFALLAVALSACGAEPIPEIRGEHETYVVSRHHVPTSNTLARELGLDLDGDDIADNQLGMVLTTLAGQNFLQSQIRTDGAIDRGDLIQLIDFQRPTAADGDAAAGFSLQVGRDPQPAACASADDVVCRHHLDGSATFALQRASDLPPLVCVDADTGRDCLRGRMRLLLGVLGDPLTVDAIGFPPTEVDLIGARVMVEDVGDGTLRGRIGGAITEADLERLMANFMQVLDADVRHDCPDVLNPPTCGCLADTAGKTYLALFDNDPKNCIISFEEFKTNSLIVSLFAPDLRLDGQALLSIGIGFEAVPATIRQ